MRNKKGVSVATVQALFPLIMILVFVLSLVIFKGFRLFVIGGGILAGVFWLASKTKDDKVKAYLIVGALIIGGILVFSSGILQSFGGTTHLAISNIQIIDGGERIRIYGVAGTGAENININFRADDISDEIENDGYKATRGVTGQIQLTKQIKKFPIIKQQDENFYKISYIELGRFSTDQDCEDKTPSGNTYLGSFRSPTLVLFCTYKQSAGTNGLFSGQAIEDSEIEFNIGGATGTLKPAQGTNFITLNDGKTKVEWTGSLNNYNQISNPNYAILFKGSQFDSLISPNAYSNFKDKERNYHSCMGLGKSISIMKNCVNHFSSNINSLLVSRTDQYTNSINANDVTFKSNAMEVDLKVASSLPTFIMTLDADSVGIIELKGRPDIVSCIPQKTINSGDTYSTSLRVKNVGDSDGSFSGSVTCQGVDIQGYVSEVLVPKGSTRDMSVQLSGSKTTPGEDTGGCTFKVEDRKGGGSDTCVAVMGVKYEGGILCEPNSERCLSANSLRKCSADGTTYQDVNCEKGCFVMENGVGVCAEGECETDADCDNGELCIDDVCIPQGKECAWWQEPYTITEKDYGFMYWRAYTPWADPIITQTPDCRLASWISFSGILLLILILGGGTIWAYSPRNKKKVMK